MKKLFKIFACVAGLALLALAAALFPKFANFALTKEDMYRCYFSEDIPAEFTGGIRGASVREEKYWDRQIFMFYFSDVKWLDSWDSKFETVCIQPWAKFSKIVALRNLLVAPKKTLTANYAPQIVRTKKVPPDTISLFVEYGMPHFKFADPEKMRYAIHVNQSGHGSSDEETLLFYVDKDRKCFRAEVLPYNLETRLQEMRDKTTWLDKRMEFYREQQRKNILKTHKDETNE